MAAPALYKQPSLPFIPGMEGAGVITELGEDVRGFKVGQHVVYAGPIGAYAEERFIQADRGSRRHPISATTSPRQ